MMYYKVYFKEVHGWCNSHGWMRVRADSAKKAREVFYHVSGRVGAEITRVRKDGK